MQTHNIERLFSAQHHHTLGTERECGVCEWPAVIQSNKAVGNFISRVQNHKAYFISTEQNSDPAAALGVVCNAATACYIRPGI